MSESTKFRIAVIGLKGLPAFGGAATVGENIIYQLKDNFNFTVFSVSSHTSFIGDLDGFRQVVFKQFPIKKFNIFVYYLKSMLYCLFSNKFDLIHLHHSDGAFILPLLRVRYKVICTSHAQPQVNEKWPSWVKVFFRLNEYIMLRFASKVTAVSRPLTEIYEGKVRREIHYIPNGISLNQKVSLKDIPYDNYVLFAAGRILPLKGLHILLDAMKLLHYNGKLLVIGDLNQVPAYRDEIVKKAEGLDITFIDIIKDKPELLNYVNKARLFVFPSYSENMSIMLLEAAFVKTPIVSSDIPANKAIFNEDEVLFFTTNDVKDLGEKISFALTNPEGMTLRVQRAFNKLKKKFNWENIATQYERLYLDLLN